MSDIIRQSTQFEIKKLAIVSKIGIIDIDGFYDELNIYDCIFNSCSSGTLLMRDSVGLTQKLAFDGSEVLLIDISKADNLANIQRTYRIYKQTNRKSVNKTTETYLLHLISDEYLLSQQQIVSKLYNSEYSKASVDILRNYLSVDDDNISTFETSKGVRKFSIPNLTPINAIQWLAKRSLSTIDDLPSFLFFENRYGYNFVTMTSLMSEIVNRASGNPVKYKFNYQIKNISIPDTEVNEFLSARHLEVVTQYDVENSIKSGIYANKIVGIDPLTGKIFERLNTFSGNSSEEFLANKTPNIGLFRNAQGVVNYNMFDSSKGMFSCSGAFSSESNYVKKFDKNMINSSDDPSQYLIKRKAIIQSLMNQRVKLVMAGNFEYTSGLVVYLNVPNISASSSSDPDNEDNSLSGNYLILAARHIITTMTHETVLEVGTNSTNRKAVYLNTDEQINIDY